MFDGATVRVLQVQIDGTPMLVCLITLPALSLTVVVGIGVGTVTAVQLPLPGLAAQLSESRKAS